jgi:chromosome segregation ATPase
MHRVINRRPLPPIRPELEIVTAILRTLADPRSVLTDQLDAIAAARADAEPIVNRAAEIAAQLAEADARHAATETAQATEAQRLENMAAELTAHADALAARSEDLDRRQEALAAHAAELDEREKALVEGKSAIEAARASIRATMAEAGI